jgi:hypothetical protein
MQAIKAARIEPVVAEVFGVDEVVKAYRAQSQGPLGKLSIRLDW